MKGLFFLLIGLLWTMLVSCDTPDIKKEQAGLPQDTVALPSELIPPFLVSENLQKLLHKTIDLNHDFRIHVGREDDLGSLKTYTLFMLSHKGKALFLDSSDTEYEFGDTLLPKVIQLDEDVFEVLVEVNDRPSKNYIKWLRIENDRLVSTDSLPTFITKLANLDGDPVLEYAGFRHATQASEYYTAYNPILYYELTLDGLKLDSNTTRVKNRAVWGVFKGYSYGETDIPISRLKDFENEILRIQSRDKL